LLRNCLLKHIIERKAQRVIEVIRRHGKRHKKLLDDLKEAKEYWKLKEEALDLYVVEEITPLVPAGNPTNFLLSLSLCLLAIPTAFTRLRTTDYRKSEDLEGQPAFKGGRRDFRVILT
jgi:hypothetical protein